MWKVEDHTNPKSAFMPALHPEHEGLHQEYLPEVVNIPPTLDITKYDGTTIGEDFDLTAG